MKLLLTSAGIANRTIARALLGLVGKPTKQINFAFVPTAANVQTDDKGWLINDLLNIKKQGFKSIDIVDISAVPRDIWLPRLRAADIVCFGGGNTFHLMYWLKKSGLSRTLKNLLRGRVYMGISAGSIVASRTLAVSQSQRVYSKMIGEYQGNEGLGLVDFHIRPHLNSPHRPKLRAKFLKQLAKKVSEPIYAIDDQSAVRVVDGKSDVVGGGKYLIV